MFRIMSKTVTFVVLMQAFTVTISSAVPDVTGINGTTTPGAAVTITGTGFGTKTSVAPMAWDNFEGEPPGTHVWNSTPAIGGAWKDLYGVDPGDDVAYSSESFHAGGISAKVRWSGSSIRAFGPAPFPPTPVLYVTWWAYQHWDSGHTDAEINADIANGPGNRKWFYAFGNSPVYGTPQGSCASGQKNCPQAMPWVGNGNYTWGYSNNGGDAGSVLYTDVTFASTHHKWQRWEYYIVLNEPASASNGKVYWWLDGVNKIANTTYRHRYFADEQWTEFYLGYMWQYYLNSADRPHVYIDDIYIDSTPSRVEMGNAAAWEANTHREIQVPSAWSDTSVTVSMNQGIFANGTTAYLYVIDANGAVNGTGFPVTIGVSADAPPSAPTGLGIRP